MDKKSRIAGGLMGLLVGDALGVPYEFKRPGDIPLLAGHFMKKYAEANGITITSIAPEVVTLLLAHEWRGNVRELENTMHRAVLLAPGSVIGRARPER